MANEHNQKMSSAQGNVPSASPSPPPSPTEALRDIVNDLDDYLHFGYRQDPEARQNQQNERNRQIQSDGQHQHQHQHDQPDSLHIIEQEVRECRRCELHKQRAHTVPGAGSSGNVQVMVIGEAPGAEEDRRGLPFVGAAGAYLDKWLAAIDMSRNNGVFITNTVKCRPPGNRDPRDTETSCCMPFLVRQIAILKPRAILCVGRISTSILLKRNVRIGADRGKWFSFLTVPLIATYHPSAVLRNPELRGPVWEDLQKLRRALDSGTFGDSSSP